MVTVGPPIGIVGFSFGLRRREPSHSNQILAQEVIRIRTELEGEGHKVVVGVQWEIAMALDHYEWCVRPVVNNYLSSSDVVTECKRYLLDPHDVTTVVPVMQPFLQSIAVTGHLRRAGFSVERRKINSIPFDPDSLQSWTRGPVPLAWYAARQRFSGYEGEAIVTEQMRFLQQTGRPPISKP